MKFKLDIEKKNRDNIGTAEGHNGRLHATKNQLPKPAWFTPEGMHVITPFNHALLKEAKGLSKRKDAVFAIEFIIQVGNQTDWRDLPTEENPFGKKQPGTSKRLNELMQGAKAAAEAVVGESRIISMVLHTDESTPHVHVIFAPIVDGKLNQKYWLNGPKACEVFRANLHAEVNKFAPCDYVKGVPKGDEHDPSKAAGAVNGPKPKPTMLEKASDLLSKISEIKSLNAVISKLNQQVQTLFSQVKNEIKKAQKVKAEHEDLVKKLKAESAETARKLKAENDDFAEKAMQKMQALQAKIRELTPTPKPKAQIAPEGPSEATEAHPRSSETIKKPRPI
jgi:hypothetical protein